MILGNIAPMSCAARPDQHLDATLKQLLSEARIRRLKQRNVFAISREADHAVSQNGIAWIGGKNCMKAWLIAPLRIMAMGMPLVFLVMGCLGLSRLRSLVSGSFFGLPQLRKSTISRS
jgi:hypothetical protein